MSTSDIQEQHTHAYAKTMGQAHRAPVSHNATYTIPKCTTALLLFQEAIANFQQHGSIVRASPAPPRRGMQRAESVLKKQRVHIDWLVTYLLPPELETVARASVFAGAL
jgi:hypothetical protein